ncbi:MAG: hypothetical protein ISP45_01740 [Reyranella sp.]|nr:hypothetical protein [Reyranella sp.]
MTPNVDERLASIVRALTDVIMPALPADAGLAREQAYLAVAHLSILRSQLDQVPDFESGEHEDAMRLAAQLMPLANGIAGASAARQELREASALADGSRMSRTRLHGAIAAVVREVFASDDAGVRALLCRHVVDHEAVRSMKDRRWFAPFGFDSLA